MQDLGGDTDPARWGELIREETAAAEADPGPARVLLARLGGERSLLVVVTEDALSPAAVLRWLLTDGAPFPGADPPPRTAGAPGARAAGSVPGLPDRGGRASGYA
ncbi:hypothetical protein SZN_30312, partial [Streptomyces zinciresistens K42]